MFGNMSNRLLRLIAFVNHVLIWVFALIIVSMLAWLLARFPNRGGHIVYQMVIAVLTLGFWLIGMFLPLVGRYRGYLTPLSWIFSYLWLTSFIFATQSWTGNKCRTRLPGPGHCGIKHAIQGFTFLVFIFLLCNIIVELLLLRAERNAAAAAAGTHNKERPGSGVSDAHGGHHNTTTSTGAAGHTAAPAGQTTNV